MFEISVDGFLDYLHVAFVVKATLPLLLIIRLFEVILKILFRPLVIIDHMQLIVC
jgi:hypothetical protein